MKSVQKLKSYLADMGAISPAASAIALTVNRLADAAAVVAAATANGQTSTRLNDSRVVNVQGEVQKFLDHFAHETFLSAARSAPVAWLLSEEEDEPIPLMANAPIALAIDPLDGSSNIAINAPVGTIFALFSAKSSGPSESFLRPGRELLAAGYFIYGPRAELVVSLGEGPEVFALDGDRKEWVHQQTAKLVSSANEFAINVSNYRHWDEGMRRFVDRCLEGKTGSLGADYNLRWLAALAGEAHRILSRGGVFFYPADRRPGYENGRLRYLYECAPIAFLIEKAGGIATDGRRPILELSPQSFHERSPLCFGSSKQMELFESISASADISQSPLFSGRNLFSTKG